jgi:uncharacterized membrane protein YkvA (DUF1232 family)
MVVAMGRFRRLSVQLLTLLLLGSAAARFEPVPAAPAGGVSAVALQGSFIPDEPVEQRLRGFTRQLIRGTRQWLRRSYRLISRSLTMWGRWLRRALFPLLVVLLALLADGPLIAAWRREGLRVLAEKVPLILYVYLRLLFAPRVAILPKILLLLSILYGVKRADLITDRGLFPGRVDDVVIIALATRAFVRSCPEEAVQRLAEQAVGWRQRIAEMRGRRRPT